jgi:predicted transcriptional regulator
MTLTEETFLILHYSRKPMRASEVAYKLYGERTVAARARAAAFLHNLKVAGLIEKRGDCTWKNIKGRRYPTASNLAASQWRL